MSKVSVRLRTGEHAPFFVRAAERRASLRYPFWARAQAFDLGVAVGMLLMSGRVLLKKKRDELLAGLVASRYALRSSVRPQVDLKGVIEPAKGFAVSAEAL